MTSTQFLQLLKREDIKYRVVDRYVDVDGNCELFGLNLTEIPIQFRHVSGSFSCHSNQLTSLMGCPVSVDGNFYCSQNQLTSLRYGPHDIDGSFYCSDNQLTSLQGAPYSVRSFYCHSNQLTSLQGSPVSVGGVFSCSHNHLTSLKGAPSSVGGDCYCANNQLTSLEGCPGHVGGHFRSDGNPVAFTQQDIQHAMQQRRRKQGTVECVIDKLVGIQPV